MTMSSRWQTRSWGSIAVLAMAVAVFWSAPRLRAHTIVEPSPVGSRFLAGSSLTPGGFFWDNATVPGPAIGDREARHMFSLQTCNGVTPARRPRASRT